jgi:putative holliday junction resolvase
MRHLGIDFGTKKVGLALSDEAGVMGFPHAVVPYDSKLLPYIEKLIEERSVGKVVIGDSRDASGAPNPVNEAAKAFGNALQQQGVPVAYEMEAFSTQEARRDFEGNRTNTEDIDASAAALILTSYLSRSHDND